MSERERMWRGEERGVGVGGEELVRRWRGGGGKED
jgi:hypothetical protein